MQHYSTQLIQKLVIMMGIYLLGMSFAYADTLSPVGLWQTVDDKTGEPRSLIRIQVVNDELTATIEKGLLPTDTEDAVCEKCKDDRKDQPLIGMNIVRGLTKNGDEYDGGTILDPDNGKVYKCKMQLDDTGNRLEVRGYIGIALIGRSQTWLRVE